MAALIVLAASALSAAEPSRSDVFGAALHGWTAEQRIKRAFVVVRHGGRVVHKSALGGAKPGAPVHLASLSKAITAACLATLIRDGKLAFDTPLSAALANFIATHGRPRDARLAGITIAQLLAHRAGFATGDDDDPASGRNLDLYLKTHTSRQPPQPSLLTAALRTKLVRDPDAQYAYGNAAYFILGAIIEEASGRPYSSYCRDAVLKPLDVPGDLDPTWRVFAAMGGWRMRAEDYLKFLDLFAADDARLGPAAKAWMLDPVGKAVPFDDSAWYGLGTFVRRTGRGVDVWHWGSWDYTPDKSERGTVRSSFAAYAARLSDGTSWFVHVEPRVEEGAPRNTLVKRMFSAYRSINARD
jgi:CubicO group peptidase (beta-lactamase class C family)